MTPLQVVSDVTFLVAQVLAGLALIIDLYAMQQRQKKAIISYMMIAGVANTLHFHLMGAKTATAVGCLFCLRMWVASRYDTPKLAGLFVALVIATSIMTWQSGLSALALTGSMLGTIASFAHSSLRLRYLFVGASVCWLVHNALIFSPFAILSEASFLASNLLGIYRHERRQKADHRESNEHPVG